MVNVCADFQEQGSSRTSTPVYMAPDESENDYIEVCTNCGAYFVPRKGQDYYDTRCGRCG